MSTLRFDGGASACAEIVLLPAIHTRPDDAVRAGFVDVVRAANRPFHLTLVDLPLADLADRSTFAAAMHDALERRTSLPLWLAGTSIGGWLALQLAREGTPAAGVGLLAPWLGARDLHREVEAAGGAARWAASQTSGTAVPGSAAEDRATWHWLAGGHLPVWLGFGRGDRFAPAQRLAATLLPASAVTEIDGAHDWHTWRRIWEHFVAWIPA